MRPHARWRRLGRLAAATTMVLAATLPTAAEAQAAPACAIDYQVRDDWGNGFNADVTITNAGDPIDGWTLTWTFPGNQRVVNGWSATWSQSGDQVTAENLTWNGTIPAGGSTTIGFSGSYTGDNDEPVNFRVNGVACNGGPANTPPTVAITGPPAGQQYAEPAEIAVTAQASDADGTVSKVEFFHDGLLFATDESAPYTATWSQVPAGDYVLVAKAYDDAGASTTSTGVPVRVTAPTTPGVVVEPNAVSVPEGGTESFTVRLSEQPASDVAVSVARTAGDSDITVVGPASLTFNTQNWSTARTVEVSAAEDADNDNGAATVTASATGQRSATVVVTESDNDQPEYVQRFLTMYDLLKNSGYFSPEGVPYHSVETLLVEAPDHGHETTSEAFSFWLWLEAQYGQVTGEWGPFNTAWQTMETYIIPSHDIQPTNSSYNPAAPATYAPEWDQPSQYPTAMDSGARPGQDPLASELTQTHGTSDVYGMHWLLDVDNVYGYGRCGDGVDGPAYINTYQRGPQESVWETVAHPSCERFRWGGTNGYLDLFIDDASYAQQWRYTNAPDADARAVQAAYWALTWATAQGKAGEISGTVAKAAKMGDYLRYAMYDKYFKRIGNCVGATACPGGTGKDSAHYLMSWYYAWGGALDTSAGWAFRIGSSFNHAGYQNPMAAWALSTVDALKPPSPTATTDWNASLRRQIELYRWLQSTEGAIAGGATNSWAGRYAQPPAGTPTFYGMFYDEKPVYHDPPSNQWFGFQAWSMQRVAEYYYVSGDATAKTVLDKWVRWAMAETTINADGTYRIPATMAWTGQPDTWNPASPGANAGLHVDVVDHTDDVGPAAAYARTLMYYAAKAGDTAARDMAKSLIDGIWLHRDDKGVSVPEEKRDYNRFDDVWNSQNQTGLYIPPGWTGTMPNGDVIAPGKSFLDVRSFYRSDPDWPKVQTYLDGGPAPVFRFHRFWAQADVAMAMADYSRLFSA